MPDITIRQVEGDELLQTASMLREYAFFPTPPMQTMDERREMLGVIAPRTTLVVFEDGKPRATGNAISMQQNVRGKLFQKGGIAGVASHPAGRRKGYVRQLMVALFNRMRDEGHAFTCLYPFRESFYQRLGYATFPQYRITRIETRNLAPLLKMDLPGEIELLEIDEGFDTLYAYLEGYMTDRHGMSLFKPELMRAAQQHRKNWVALVRRQGEVVGVMLYKIKGYLEDMVVYPFLYDDMPAKFLMLQWFARHIDQVSHIEIKLGPDELPETWYADLKAYIKTEDWVTPMGRVLDVAGIGGMKVGPGRVVLNVKDPYCDWNDGVWTFESVNGELVVKSGGVAEGMVTINGLSALVYGTHHNLENLTFREWLHAAPDLQKTLHSLFPPERPFLFEGY